MRTFLLFFFLFSHFVNFSWSQTLPSDEVIQKGKVREINTNKRPLEGVYLEFDNAGPEKSADDGTFRLFFRGKKPGDPIFFKEISKKGFEIVNNKELESLKISNGDQFGVDILMAPEGKISEYKKRYYEISDKELLAGFYREKNNLKTKLNQALLLQNDYWNQLSELQKQYERQKKELDVLAEQFARINFDDVDSIYRQSLDLFKSGKIDEAIQKLEKNDPIKRFDQILIQEKKDADDQAKLDEKRANTQRAKRSVIEHASLLADMYNLKFDPAKAIMIFDSLVAKDSSNLEILLHASKFYQENHLYLKSLHCLSLIIRHSASKPIQIARAIKHSGDIFLSIGDRKQATIAFKESLMLHESLWKSDTGSIDFKQGVGLCYLSIGDIMRDSGDLKSALLYYDQSLKTNLDLFLSHPKSGDIKHAFANSNAKIGEIYLSMSKMEKSLTFFKESTRLYEELLIDEPGNSKYQDGLAGTYSRVGDIMKHLGNLEESLLYHQKSRQIKVQINEKFPLVVDYKYNLSISYYKLGLIYATIGEVDSAKMQYSLYQEIIKSLHEDFPLNIRFRNGYGLACYKIAELQVLENNLPDALVLAKEFNQIEISLSKIDSVNVEYKTLLGISYMTLGDCYEKMDSLTDALDNFEKANDITKALHLKSPLNANFKSNLALSFQRIGHIHSANNNFYKALDNYKSALSIGEQLCTSFPNNISFSMVLSTYYSNLGESYTDLGMLDSAFVYYEKDLNLSTLLYAEDSLNTFIKYNVATANSAMGEIYFNYLKNNIESLRYLLIADTILTELLRESPESVEYKKALKINNKYIDKVRAFTQAGDSGLLENLHVIIKSCNLYESPNKNSRSIKTMKIDEIVFVIDKNNNSWWKISSGKDIGYVKSKMIRPKN